MGKPDDFDWVAARQACSLKTVFERLVLLAKRDVEAMKVTQGERVFHPFDFVNTGDGFSVSGSSFRGNIGVRFFLEDRQIVAESHRLDPKVSLRADLTLNDDGECRLLVDKVELQEWQFLKRALEPLLFGNFGR
ncbi:MAG: hypothetical protein ACRD2N_20225 [Vicinamibacterales bacterium]